MIIKLRLADFEDDRLERDFEVAAEDIGLNSEFDPMRARGPIRVALAARQTGEDDILVQAKIRWRFVQECVSCLDEIVADRVEDFTMLFVPARNREALKASSEAESPDLGYYQGDEIELDEEIAGFLLQVVDEYPRCRPDCRGLDPNTGENLNRASPAEKASPKKADKAKKDTELVPEWKRKLMELSGGGDDA